MSLLQRAGFCCLLLFSQIAWSACSDVFPSGVASASASSTITLASQADILSTPSNQIITQNLVQGDASNCGTSACTQSNTLAQQTTDFNSFNGGADISVGFRANQNLTPGHYGSLTGDNESSIRLSPGDYYFDGNVQLNFRSEMRINGAGTARVFISGNFFADNEVEVNMQGNNNKYLYLYVRGTTGFDFRAEAKAVVYSIGAITVDNEVELQGALTSEANIDVDFRAEITYSASDIATLNFGGDCASSSTLDNFTVDMGTGTASVCAPIQVVITARDSGDTAINDYTGTITLSSTPGFGDWSLTGTAADAQGTLTLGANDSGDATYAFVDEDDGTILLNFTNTHAVNLTVTAADTTAMVAATSGSRTFAENAFVVTSLEAPWGEDVIAARDHRFQISMYTREPAGADCAIATNYNVASVKAWVSRSIDMLNGDAPVLENTGASSTPTLSNAKPASNNLSLPFVAGVAEFTLLTSDVGKFTLMFADDGLSFSDQEISGSSNPLVVRPFGFYVDVPSNPAASSALGNRFLNAGETFTVSVTAVGWQAGDDDDADGVPNGYDDSIPNASDADLSTNPILASFGTETPPETVSLTSVLFLPGLGNDPGLDVIASPPNFSGGTANYSVRFNEVGIININAAVADGDYLGAGTTATNKALSWSSFVGRFSPAYFDMDNVSYSEFCSISTPFTYMGQTGTVSYDLIPKTQNDGDIRNYRVAFDKIIGSELRDSFVAIDQQLPTLLTTRVAVATPTPAYLTTGIRYSHALGLARPSVPSSAPDGPYTLLEYGFLPIDDDDITVQSGDVTLDADNDTVNDSVLLASTETRFGRLRLADAYGPETATLPVDFLTEYWNGSFWATNTADSCTQIPRDVIQYPNGNIATASNLTVSVGGGSSTGSYANLSATDVNFSLGEAGHAFSAPGAGNTGRFLVDVDLTNIDWLRFDWDNDGSYDDVNLPSATFTFGTYRGHDRILYWHEVLQ